MSERDAMLLYGLIIGAGSWCALLWAVGWLCRHQRRRLAYLLPLGLNAFFFVLGMYAYQTAPEYPDSLTGLNVSTWRGPSPGQMAEAFVVKTLVMTAIVWLYIRFWLDGAATRIWTAYNDWLRRHGL